MKPARNFREDWRLYAELAAVAAIAAGMVLRLLYKFVMWPDTTNYLSAATNFVRSGTLHTLVNWPSSSFVPGIEIYTDAPPGFPFFLAFFVAIFGDPITAAAWAQSLTLVAFTFGLYALARELGFSAPLRIALPVFFLIFPAFRDIFAAVLTEPLYMLLSMGIFFCALRLVRDPGATKYWYVAGALLFATSGLRWYGFCSGAPLLYPLLRTRPWPRLALRAGLLGVVSVAPILLWFWRNLGYKSGGTSSYRFGGILWHKAAYPFEHMVTRWGFGYLAVALTVLAFSLTPLVSPRLRKIIDLPAYWLLWVGALSQFFAIYLLSLLVEVTPVDDRYQSPAYLFFIFILFCSLHASLAVAKFRALRFAPWFLIALFAPAVVVAIAKRPVQWIGTFTRPPEEALWQVIRARPYYEGASHFYTDDNFVHQLFGGIPHRIVWDNLPAQDPEKVKSFWGIGNRPFFVVKKGTLLHKLFEERLARELGAATEVIGEFQVYHRP